MPSVMKQHVIKKHMLRHPPAGPERTAPPEQAEHAEGPAASVYPLRRILRGDDARTAAEPFHTGATDLEADFPLFLQGGDSPAAPVLPKDVEQLRRAWEAEARARLDGELAAAREEAYDQGYAAARAELAASFEAQQAALMEDVNQLKHQVATFFERSGPELVHLAFEVARVLLDAPLPPEMKRISERALSEAVEQLAGTPPIEIALHPVDYLRLQESGLVDQLTAAQPGLRWEPRPHLKQGEWIVASPAALIRRLEEELIGLLKGRLGVPAPARDAGGSEDEAQEA